jgi:hypothetical protein
MSAGPRIEWLTPDRIRGQVGRFGVFVLDEDVVLAARHG